MGSLKNLTRVGGGPGAGGDWGAQCGQQGVHWSTFLGGVGQGGRQGGEMGGGAPESVGATRRALVPPFGLPYKPNNWSDLAGDEGGRRGGGWAREAGKGGKMGGGKLV